MKHFLGVCRHKYREAERKRLKNRKELAKRAFGAIVATQKGGMAYSLATGEEQS